MAPYEKFHEDWKDLPDVTTPVSAEALEHIEDGVATAQNRADDAHDIATAAAGAGVADGDKGDVTVSGSGTVWSVDAVHSGSSHAVIQANAEATAAADATTKANNAQANAEANAAIDATTKADAAKARATHTGSQAIGTVTGLQAALDSKVDQTTFDDQRDLVDGDGTTVNTSVAGEVALDIVGPDVQDFTAAGAASWVPPAWATADSLVEVDVVGPGGSGGSGRRGAGATIRGGGGGGASGNRSRMTFRFGDLTLIAGAIPIVVGAPGAVGAAITVNDTNGSAGAAGTDSSFGIYLVASAGGPGQGGTSADGGVGGTIGTRGMFPGLPGAKGGGVAAAESNATKGLFGTTVLATSGPGGGGQGTDAANAVQAPSDGGAANAYSNGATVGGTAGVPGTTTDAVAGATSGDIFLASGGGGGQTNVTAVGRAGAAGGFPGGGGGGGGRGANGVSSGPGGLGGGGRIRVTTRR